MDVGHTEKAQGSTIGVRGEGSTPLMPTAPDGIFLWLLGRAEQRGSRHATALVEYCSFGHTAPAFVVIQERLLVKNAPPRGSSASLPRFDYG